LHSYVGCQGEAGEPTGQTHLIMAQEVNERESH
jgi:hypothetical protein